MHHLRPLVDRLRGCRVLVVGDLMLDEYLRGEVSRISPEAPVPILEVRTHESRLGGAANTAANIQALGGTAFLVGVVGKDETAITLGEQLSAMRITSTCVPDGGRPTSKKTRLVASQQQIVRVDQEKRHAISGPVLDAVKHAIDGRIKDAHAVVISDYAKGVITQEIARYAITRARAGGLPVVVDPKQRDFTLYAGATVITPNLAELEAAAVTPVPFEVGRIVAELLPALEGAALLVTRSAEGMSLFQMGVDPIHVPAIAKEVFDVTGAGDTVVATLALALAAKLSFAEAIELASVAAAISVSKRGTSTVNPAELLAALDASPG